MFVFTVEHSSRVWIAVTELKISTSSASSVTERAECKAAKP
jgi:hypothetical protein